MARPKQADFELATQILSTNLRRLREQAGLTQAELAIKAGVSRSLVQKIELAVQTGSRPAQLKLAIALNVDLAVLLTPLPSAQADFTLVVKKPETEKPASSHDLKNFNRWLAENKPTKGDLVQLKKLVQLYFKKNKTPPPLSKLNLL